MYATALGAPKGKFPRYLLTSFILHLLILIWLSKILPAPTTEEVRLALEIVPSPPKQKIMPKPKQAKPTPDIPVPPKPTPISKAPKPIPKESTFPAQPEIAKDAKFSMFEENLKAPPKATKHPVPNKELAKKLPGSTALQKTQTKQIEKKTSSTEKQPPPPPQGQTKEFAIRTEDLFVRREQPTLPPTAPSTQSRTPAFNKLFSSLEAEKYGDAGYAGEGVLSFADSNFKSVWYGRIVKKKVVDGWFPPYAARALGLTGRTIITFRIQQDGHITDIKVEDSSGNQSLDKAALFAVKSADPLPGLPSDYNYDTLGVIFSFWYNIHPPSEG